MAKRVQGKGKDQGPWQIDGISPEAITAATAAAEQDGLDLSNWLNRLIRDAAEAERRSRATPRDTRP